MADYYPSEAAFADQIRVRKYKELFLDLGWDNISGAKPETLYLPNDTTPYPYRAVVEKRGFVVLVCSALPSADVRRRLDLQLSKRYAEHLLIFAPADKPRQIWQLVSREPGKPIVALEFDYHHHQTPRALYQRVLGLAFSLDEEDALNLVDVRERVRRRFTAHAEKVTKKFYTEFSRQHKAFQTFITGIEDVSERQWYASIMLNRLMFIYFIQAQGYLDNNLNYLEDKLAECQQKVGKGKFHSFYQSFLRVLFDQGFNGPTPHNPALQKLIGRVPYLNGGLFEVHQLEAGNEKLHIPDEAFAPLLAFFSGWEWHLDTRSEATGKEINPDVIGYIFERYINERAKMGAYYTKEDITEYIAQNTIIPALFDRIEQEAPHGPALWHLLRDEPLRYVYESAWQGIDLPLPASVTAARKDVSARTVQWNQKTPAEYALPTELWRETIARLDFGESVADRLTKGKVTSINELVTLNLNIRQFAQDAIRNSEDSEWVWQCYDSLRTLSVLDPTCGSGAFLFAALNILEPLYEACLDRMAAFLPDLEDPHTTPVRRARFEEMQTVRAQIDAHPNRQYFITKSIILHNLYGVDIMHEAVEIAKLRLFLQLMATLGEPDYDHPNLGLEPLPDIDFNIRTGNTLVGFATEKELEKGLMYDFDGQLAKPGIEAQCDKVADSFTNYKALQLMDGEAPHGAFQASKTALEHDLLLLNMRLNGLLHKQNHTVTFDQFSEQYQPFHWFAEFYDIINDRKGFDIIIGNPPYVEITPRLVPYKLQGFATESCGNLYAVVSERADLLLNELGRFAFIIPSASCCTPRMEPLMKLMTTRFDGLWVSLYDERPGKLFDGVDQQLCIQVAAKKLPKKQLHITGMRHWQTSPEDERPYLFENVQYVEIPQKQRVAEVLPKISTAIEAAILKQISTVKATPLALLQITGKLKNIYYRNAGGRYWRLVKSTPSYFNSSRGDTSSSTELTMAVSGAAMPVLVALYSSSLFYWYWRVVSNCRHLTKRELAAFPISTSLLTGPSADALTKLAKRYEKRLADTAVRVSTDGKSGWVEQDEYRVNQAKPILDEIDQILAQHYGLNAPQLDYIINYDIKYRMGLG